MLLIPLFAALVQLGLTLYVRNTLAACVQAAARYGADENFIVAQGDKAVNAAKARATTCIDASLPDSYSSGVAAQLRQQEIELQVDPHNPVAGSIPVVEVTDDASVPFVIFFGEMHVSVHVTGDALQERP